MRAFIDKFVVVGLVVTILAASSNFLFAQPQKLMGDLSITKISPEGFVTLNGERVVSGRSVASPSVIATSPQASAVVFLAKTGTLTISPNSKLNVSFIESSMSVDIFAGDITIETVPNTALNLFTPDGNLTLPVVSQANIIRLTVVNNKTVVQALTGKAMFNSVTVSAGESYPVISNSNRTPNTPVKADDDSNNAKGFNPLLIVGLLGAAGAVALIALSGGGSGNSDAPPVTSPTR